MQRVGPTIETLTSRLVATPPDFLDEPRIGNAGKVAVAALVNDLMCRFGKRLPIQRLSRFQGSTASSDRNRLALVMVTVWLLADRWFFANQASPDAMLRLLDETLAELAGGTAAHKFVSDPDRREELARIALARLDFRPEGETIAQATDRLSSVSSSERRRLLEASREAQQRARAIREALAKKAAEESADKWTRE